MMLKVYDNGDHTGLIFLPVDDQPIPNCWGFAIQRIKNGKTDFLENYVGFENNEKGFKGTDQWPVQRYLWWDYDVKPGDSVQYQIIPAIHNGSELELSHELASGLSPAIKVSSQCSDSLSAYFNKGIIASQWVARALDAEGGGKGKLPTLTEVIQKPGNELRDQLGGLLKQEILKRLDDAKASGGKLFAALYELNDPELEERLTALGAQVNLVLGNGAFKGKETDENAEVRQELKDKSQVKVYDRIVSSPHFAHNKFVVFCDAAGKAKSVLSGSTNWTMTGLCTQANNALFIDDPDVAEAYRQQWDRLHDAGNGFPTSLVKANSQQKTFQVDSGKLSVWFTPTDEAEDLQYARQLINAAKHGILFLFFNPGPFQDDPNRWTLLQNILSRHQSSGQPYYDPSLFIRGVVNQQIPKLTEPGATGDAAPAANAPPPHASHNGRRSPGRATGGEAHTHDLDPASPVNPVSLFSSSSVHGDSPISRLNKDVLVPAYIKSRYDKWDTELKGASMVMVHSKVIVIDPFGESPVVMTGSHNLGPKASGKNDDNLVIIEGNHALAASYALNIIAIYDTYRWRSYVTAHQTNPTGFHALNSDDKWQAGHLSGEQLEELEFFLGLSHSQAPMANPIKSVSTMNRMRRGAAAPVRPPVAAPAATDGNGAKSHARPKRARS